MSRLIPMFAFVVLLAVSLLRAQTGDPRDDPPATNMAGHNMSKMKGSEKMPGMEGESSDQVR